MKKMKDRDPRQPPPIARIRDILHLYFSQIQLELPSTCPLDMLLDILVGYCEQSPYKDRFISADAKNKYNEAYGKLPALYAGVSQSPNLALVDIPCQFAPRNLFHARYIDFCLVSNFSTKS